MKVQTIAFMGLLSFLFGCESRNPYHKKDGQWHFEKLTLRVDDDRDFTPLNRRFARSGKEGFYRSSTVTTTNGESCPGTRDGAGLCDSRSGFAPGVAAIGQQPERVRSHHERASLVHDHCHADADESRHSGNHQKCNDA